MAKRHRRWLALIILTWIVWVVSISCYLSDEHEVEENTEWREYAIDSATLLGALDRGEPNAFILLEATPIFSPSLSVLNVHWDQADYYRIAQAIHKQAWAIPLDSHNLYDVSFYMECSDAEEGIFNFAEFKSNDVMKTDGKETRLEHWTTIKPRENLVVAVGIEYRPNIFYKKPFDMLQFRITADNGVQLAENNGGAAARLQVDNNCEISVFTTEDDGRKWRILYVHFVDESDHIGTTIYDIIIDPYTGKYRVLYPEP